MSEPLEAWIAQHGETVIWADFPREALEAGERLLRAQAVLDSSPGGQGFFARVQADRRHVHSVDCRVHPLPSPKPVTTYCTCAAGGGCEHAVAALLFYLGRKTPAGLVKANPAVHQWLSELDRLSEDAGSNGTERRTECLVYLLDDDGAGRVTVTPRRARPRRRGGYGRLMAFQGLRRAPAGLLGADDRRLLRLLPEAGQAILPEDLNFLLTALAETGRAHWQRTETPALSASGPRDGAFVWRVESDGSQRLVPVAGDGLQAYPALPPIWLDTTTGEFGTIETGVSMALVARLQSGPAVAPADVPAMADGLVQRGLPVPAPRVPSRRRIDDIAPAPCLRLTRLNGGAHAVRVDAGEPVAEVGFDYAGHLVAADDPAETLCVYEHGELLEYRRDSRAESSAIGQLEVAGLERAGCMAGDRFMPGHVGGWRPFVAETLPRLREAGWRVTTEPAFPWRLAEVALWQADARRDKDQPGWFTFDLSVEVEGERHALLPLLLAIIRENPEAMSTRHLDAIDPASSLLVDLGDGRLIPVPADRLVPLLRGLTELYDPALRLDQGRLRLPLGRANALDRLAESAGRALHWQGDQDLRALGRTLGSMGAHTDVTIPNGLRGELRPYQRDGLAWLQQLAQVELGGVLADDMGLGKTLQVLAHLQLEKEAGRARAPSLVVVPTSLMFNWAREAEKFTPGLRVLRLHGPHRHAEYDRLGHYDLVLTTYSLLVRDIARLHGQPWHLLVLDEAQAVKNPRAQAARAVRTLEARQRLSLTGTPLENHLGELWAQFDFVAPGLLGNASAFKRTYRRPIEQDRDESRLTALRERVGPFLLRRTKQAIARDLPPKTEISLYAELVGGQRDLYEQLRLGQQARVREALAEQGHPQSRVLILDALLKLREACCDPRLVAGAPESARASAKLELLLELVDDLMQAGRRVIVFSQFTRMLTIIEQGLNERGHAWTKLTGETRDREAAVARFQFGDVPIFLVSLKAGGTGLNLTAADTVIHYDPWWNPAVTRQATDRAHRIGQDQPVFVYHLLTRDTVEDRIMALQRDKAELGERLLGDAAEASAARLDPETVTALFGPLADDAPAEQA
ncbi:SNF2 family DNA/RNA helicase [Spiribacter salinus M19-40]|uniref:SNF2 family DNA/RNA helicase n=1 Tax=Spiribacter salinus M19-40 TaxID=1260251 RepID=R4VIN5_9GAMM|nr:DEAD/DEAH box helicase [Spiribacter salinus]AGM40457.1 SNF2 family DNA/RNA helicase [Spiribacter salinus M19-40]